MEIACILFVFAEYLVVDRMLKLQRKSHSIDVKVANRIYIPIGWFPIGPSYTVEWISAQDQ